MDNQQGTKMTDMPELTERQSLLLKLIVREHVESTGPVASRTLVEKYNLKFSPATVRNEMAALESLGYLTQPHTSAGRMPTEAGFRYFVARLMEEQSLPLAEQRRIAHQFYQARDRIESWLPLASSVLAQTSGGASVVTAPRTMQPVYKHLELILTHGRAILLILVLQGGMVEQQMLALSEPMTQTALREAADRLNQIFAGLRAADIESRIGELPSLEADVARLVISIMRKSEGMPSDEIYQHGLSELLQEPEFVEGDVASTSVVRVLEERSLLQAVLSETLTPAVGVGNVCVLIGGEGRWDELRACSIVLTRYGVMDYATGALGVVGPIRMPYGRTISAVRFVANILGEMVYEMYEPGTREPLLDFEGQF
ncbi:MAG TPA: heat-inducible transcriptional repressor HrcA [Anaerolineae bacterium]|nr:heat-inducible transcriptional repressor HrcA [Anaerolineae bacterium]HQK14164.1 heat-inducible transcriptional repressor HrcA [Anaerolineae bacterium]